MSETNIQWTARHRIDPAGTCAHGATCADRCLDIGCERCWVQGHTVNPWIGCEKVSAACKNCYAEVVAENRMGISVWGKGAPRRLRPDAAVKDLLRINRRAKKTGQRVGVFSGSMCDLFEDRADLVEPRATYLAAVTEATSVDVMLLTKRPENIRGMVPKAWILDRWPRHVWPGATAETQETLDERAPHLLRLKAGTTFLSVEPMLGPLDAREFLAQRFCMSCKRGVPFGEHSDPPAEVRANWIDHDCEGCPYCNGETDSRYPDEYVRLVILGGESGGGARSLAMSAAESLVQQCVNEGACLFFKQMGSRWAQQHGGALKKGASHGQDPYRWPAWARRRELPVAR